MLFSLAIILVLVSCATQPDAPPEEASEPEVAETEPAEPESAPAVVEVEEPTVDPLTEPGVAYFETVGGQKLIDGSTATLPTGGPPSGRIIPMSDNPGVLLYVTRDGSKPSAGNNWGGAIAPGAALPITKQSEGAGTYSIVAELDGNYSAASTINIVWLHDEEASIDRPQFVVDGDEVSGRVTLPISNGGEMKGRLYIECDYSGATLFITNDGTEPSATNYLYTQVAEGTYLYSPDAAEVTYRVVATWQGATSPISEISVTWGE